MLVWRDVKSPYNNDQFLLLDCIILYFNLTITTAIALLMLMLLKRGSKRFRHRVKTVYIMLALWVLANVAKNVYSLIVYHAYAKQMGLTSANSQVFAFLDTIPALIVQTMFLAIPYKMWNNVLGLLMRRLLVLRTQEHELLNFLTFYVVLRWVILLFPWIILILVPSSKASQVNFAKLSLQIIDSLICNILLFLSLKSFLHLFQKIQLNQVENKQKLKLQYWLMVICSSLRFLIDLGFLIVLPMLHSTECIGPFKDHLYYSIGYTLLGTLIMHFMPVALVMYVYRPIQ